MSARICGNHPDYETCPDCENEVDYHAYLQSPGWKAKREAVFAERGRACERCGDTRYLHIHHLTYDNLGAEPLEDLRILCWSCHDLEHPKRYNPL